MELSYFFLIAMFLPAAVTFNFIEKQQEVHPSLETLLNSDYERKNYPRFSLPL